MAAFGTGLFRAATRAENLAGELDAPRWARICAWVRRMRPGVICSIILSLSHTRVAEFLTILVRRRLRME